MMEDCENEELDDRNQNNINEGKTIVDEEGNKSTDTENEEMIHRDMNENETETNKDNLDKVIEYGLNVTSPAIMED